MRTFIDFEAFSLCRHGFPIEVAWVFEDGNSETFLILPIDTWTEWDPANKAAASTFAGIATSFSASIFMCFSDGFSGGRSCGTFPHPD